jgi:hypothetical protein
LKVFGTILSRIDQIPNSHRVFISKNEKKEGDNPLIVVLLT